MYKRLTLFLLIGLMFLTGCQAAAPRATSEASRQSSGSAPAAAAPAEPQNSLADKAAVGNGAAVPAVQPGAVAQSIPADKRLVIRNANLTIILEDPGKAMTAVSQMAETMGGYVVNSNLYQTTGVQGKEFPEATISIRVPAEKLNEALNQIHGLVKDPNKDVTSETITGQDVTKEYTDLSSREKNLEATAAQLKEIMASATKTEDVLAVYNQLSQVQEQIEVLKGQIKYYEESAAFSSISVVIRATASVKPLEIGGWQPVGVARNAVQALINTMQVIGSAAIWLILYVLPVALAILLPLRLLWWFYRRGQKNRKAQTPAPPAAAA